jgi:hypothetical protein
MRFNKVVMGSLFVAALGVGASAAVIEEVKVTPEGAKKFGRAPKIVDVNGEKAFVANKKGYTTYYINKKIKIDPEKKYQVSLKVKQFGEKPAYVYIGFIPLDAKGRSISPQQGFNNTKGSATVLAADVAKGAKSLTVKDASKWKKGKADFVAFNVKADMSDIPNFEVAGAISKIEKTGDVYTINFPKALNKAYPAGTKVRQHTSGGTFIYTKSKNVPKEWTVWKGLPVQGKILRKATTIRPMILVKNTEDSGVAFTDLVVEEIDK